jgi:hypothetical protein
LTLTEKQAARFWERVDRSGGADACWPWMGSRRKYGHGEVRIGRKLYSAHRVAYVLSGNDLADDQILRHTCNNGWCCNPRHHIPGTHVDNVRDRVAAGRSAYGARNGRAKLTYDAVLLIRELVRAGQPKTALARQFGVSPRCIAKAVNGELWRTDDVRRGQRVGV